jgi:hypothetical protein
MTSPIGKILLAKLPKDIIQFCIEPMLMISEEEVRKTHRQVMGRIQCFNPASYKSWTMQYDNWPMQWWRDIRQDIFTEERILCTKLHELRKHREWMHKWMKRIPWCQPFVVWGYNSKVNDYNAILAMTWQRSVMRQSQD